MESLEGESLTKSAKKKKEAESQAVKLNRKISDFFKTPEKQKDKQKQKSLLQFFTKSCQDNDEKSDNNCTMSMNENNAANCEVSTATNSDKENNEILEEKEVVNENSDCKSKSKKEQKEKCSGERNDKVRKGNKAGTGGNVIDKKKQKKKKPTQDEHRGSVSDSVIILSDNSLSQPATDHGEIQTNDDTCKAEICDLVKETKVTLSNSNKIETKFGIEMDCETVKEAVEQTKIDSEDINIVDEELKGSNKIESFSTSQIIDTKYEGKDEMSLENNKSKQVLKKVQDESDKFDRPEKKKKVKKNSQSVPVKVDEERNEIEGGKVVEEMKDEKQKLENQIAEKRKSKKLTLKGKDMLNLLKEIQSGEVEEAKKRKGKRKHKHHKAKDVLEIAITDDNSDKEDKKEDCKTKSDKLGQNEYEETSKSVKEKNKSTEKAVNGRFIDVNDVHKGEKKKLVKGKTAHKPKLARKSQNKKSDQLNTEKQKLKKSTEKVTLREESDQLSYEDFTETLDCKKSQMPTTSANGTKEMSYTEYLQLLEKTKGDDIADSVDNISDNVDSSNNDGEKGDLKHCPVSGEDTAEEELVLETGNIKKFFSVTTSTPARGTCLKNGTKIPAGKAKDIDKLNTSKAESCHDTDCEIVETSSKMDIDEEIDSETLSNDKRSESKDEIQKGETSSKGTISGRKTQATLAFGKTGLTVSKPVSKSDEEESKDKSQTNENSNDVETQGENLNEKEKAVKPRRGRKPKKNKVALDSTDSSVFATPENVRKRQVKRKLDEEDSESAESGERRRSLRKRYKVEAFQMDADRKTPIKIKLKRCPKSSSSGEDSERSMLISQKLKVNAKQSTAMALLEKAKRGKHKKHKIKNSEKTALVKKKESKKKKKVRNASNSSEDSVTRRSSRLEGRSMASMEEVSLENIVISSSEDEGQEEKPLKKRGRPKGSKNRGQLPKKDSTVVVETSKGTPQKNVVKVKTGTPSKNKTPSKKAGMKLAPMFMVGKNKLAQPSPKKIELDPETLKQRQAFLMSGVPEELRKQTATRVASQVEADYPPIPRTSHVLQVPTDVNSQHVSAINIWDLMPVELSLRSVIMPVNVAPVARFTGDLMARDQQGSNWGQDFKDFKGHVPVSEHMAEQCLKEIACFNSAYPVTAMYKALKEMKTETEAPPPKSESMLTTDMKGILDGCTDMMVINDEEEDAGQKKKKKKSLKLQKKAEKPVSTEESEVEEKTKPAGTGLLWTEKYCPAKTADVLGNSGVLKKLKTWLTEWKHVLDREARKARKLLMKKNKGKQMPNKKVDDDLWDDDSDFDLDSDDDDDSLCNTMLLTGPHGCGKTSSVYALALELGFKVHEVNASSCRSGKQIVSQLQEATQSHQVSSQGNHTPRKNTALGDKPKPENKLPTAFTNLFKKSAPKPENKQEEKQPGKKRKRNTSDKDGGPKRKSRAGEKHTETKAKSLQLLLEDSNSQNVAKSLNLSSTTLILFDEVDVVFDEDRGFVSAIQNFMSKTKIPIILTTADPGFTDTFEGRYEQMNFKRPSLTSITAHLQTVSLVENVRTDPALLAELAVFYHCDMRRCLMALQFLLESGGGHSSLYKVIQATKQSQNTANILALEGENSQSSLPGDSVSLNTGIKQTCVDIEGNSEASRDVDNSDDDFVTIKPLKKRRRVLEDDNSNSVDTCLKVPVDKPVETATIQDSEIAKNYPRLHQIGLESFMYRNSLSIAESLSQALKAKSTASLQDMICTCCCVKRSSNSDLMYNNLPILLPFEMKIMDSVLKVDKDCSSPTKTRKRIKTHSDLYDSEASNDASVLEKTEDQLAGKTEDKLAETEDSECVQKESKEVIKGNRAENLCVAKSLSCFAQFYETMSSLDVLESTDRMKVGDTVQALTGREVKGTLSAGMENVLPSFQTHGEVDLDTGRLYSAEIEGRSFCRLYSETSSLKEEIEQLRMENETFAESFVLPVTRQHEQFTLVESNCISVPTEYKRAYENTVDNLPLVTRSHPSRLHLDYLPTLREICRTEQCRQITNTKRRFHHYLDSITLPLKDRTVTTLATTFV